MRLFSARSILFTTAVPLAIGGCAARHHQGVQPSSAAAAAGGAAIPDERAVGRLGAPITIEVFSDFQCTGCAEFQLTTLARIRDEYCVDGRVRLVHHEYPLPIPSHRYAHQAARWALAAAAVGKYEEVADALFRDQRRWGQTGDIEGTASTVLAPAELGRVVGIIKREAVAIDSALARDMALGRAFPVHGTPSFRILVHRAEVFADHDEPDKLTPTTPRLKVYSNLKRYLDEQLSK